MIKNIIDTLASNDWYSISERVEIAKGKHSYPKSLKEAFNKIKRVAKWQEK
jgi:hypothetical protein